MRKNGVNIIQELSTGPSLFSPLHANELSGIVPRQENGFITNTVRALSSGLGIGSGQAVDRDVADDDQLCAAFGLLISDRDKPFLFSDGIAIIPVTGALLHRDSYSDSYATGYDFIRARFELAMEDPDVQGIVFDVNSYGGMVTGNFELADVIYEARGKKPTLAMVDAKAYSGGYSLASAAGRIVATPSSGVGSIGVVMLHVSFEKAYQDFGVDVSMIYAGKHKVDGNPYQALPDEVRARFQVSVEKTYDKFVSLVARNRGMSVEAVSATEALCYDADEALALGLIDAIQSPKEAATAFRNGLNGSTTITHEGTNIMADTTQKTDAGNSSATTAAPANAEATPATVAAPAATQAEAPAADSGKIERERIQSIMSCDEAKERQALANHLAFNTSMSADDARKTLAAAPLAKTAASGASAFEQAMARDNPNVGVTGGEEDNGGKSAESVSVRILSAYSQATGNKFNKESRQK